MAAKKDKRSAFIKFVLLSINHHKDTPMGKTDKNRDKPREHYKLTNWSAYNSGLKNRGKLTVWLSDDVRSSWLYEGDQQPGGELIYIATYVSNFV